MSTDRDLTRIVRSWLDEGVTALPDRVLDAVLDQVPATPQRRAFWLVRRFSAMNNVAKLAIAAAAVLVAAVVGINLLPASGGRGGGPTVSPSPTPSPTPQPSPSPTPAAFPPEGGLSVGTHLFTVNGVPFTLEVSTSGWSSAGFDAELDGGSISKGQSTTSANAWMPMWSLDGVYADPCGRMAAPPAGPSAEDLAAAFTTIPGTDATGPTDVTVGGLPAKLVVVTVPEDIGCAPNQFYLWYDDIACGDGAPCSRWASALGSTTRIWIVEVDGTRLTFEAETYEGASPELEQEIQQMIDSIQFE
jgi:hypothetical protein